jgi:tetratricopeptide (TPR) repeat protein
VLDVAGRTVVLLGRFAAMPRPRAVQAVTAAGGSVRRAVTRKTELVVVGAAGWNRLADGALQRRIERAEAVGARCVSEQALWTGLGVSPAPAGGGVTLDADGLRAKSGLDEEALRWLSLFGLIGDATGRYGFADLGTARHAARLLAERTPLVDVIGGLVDLRRRGRPLGVVAALVRDPCGGVAVQSGAHLAGLDGQLRLPFDVSSWADADEAFERAEAAEEDEDFAAAAVHYRRCVDLDRADPIAAYNLANVLRELERCHEARIWLQHALAIDPDFAEAWYNLADLLEEAGDDAAARRYLERAVAADPTYADARFNLGRLCFGAGDTDEAAECWRAYLRSDPDSVWSAAARSGLRLCEAAKARA